MVMYTKYCIISGGTTPMCITLEMYILTSINIPNNRPSKAKIKVKVTNEWTVFMSTVLHGHHVD